MSYIVCKMIYVGFKFFIELNKLFLYSFMIKKVNKCWCIINIIFLKIKKFVLWKIRIILCMVVLLKNVFLVLFCYVVW